MIRLKDIAQRAGVSVMTVSKVMRDAPDISAATKVRVKSLAQQMGYVPDSNAQSLRTRTSRLMGVIIPSVTEPNFARVILAIEERAHELGFELILAHTFNQEGREEACIQRLLARRVDGLFISPVYRLRPDAPVYQILQARGTPVVIIGHSAPFCRQFFNVESDDVQGSYAATQHLLQLGHRHIAFFGGPQAAPWAQERFEGYRRALRDANLDVEDRLVFQAGSTIEDGAKTALQFVNESTKATAIQAVNDLVAIGCADTFLNQGIKIPDQLSVVGFGNILTSEYFRVPMTTVRQPKFRLGAAAMDSMVKLLRRERPESKRLRAELIIRASTAAPAA
ncbi:MAG TPA: LacI family DNA-binding transcriptional regulator [Verrucomicrobiae bacterium]|jgi:LacI family transcriptional regulator|nr:LacI family DNA-binding transcriptional regulator [Verrucomicrobiae bacterium]